MFKSLDWKLLLTWLIIAFVYSLFALLYPEQWKTWLGIGIGLFFYSLFTRYLDVKREEWEKVEKAKMEMLRIWQAKYPCLDGHRESFPQEARDFVTAVKAAVVQGEFSLKDIDMSEGELWYLLDLADFLEDQRSKNILSHKRECEIFKMINEWNAKGAFDPSYPFVSDTDIFEGEEIDEQRLREDAKKLGISFEELKEYHEQVRRSWCEEEAYWQKMREEDSPWKREQDEWRQRMEENDTKKGFFVRILSMFWK